MEAALLPDRGIVRLTGDDAASFLNGLVTSDVSALAVGDTRFAALLTPQGKIVVDFLVYGTADGLLLDCPRALAASLSQKLGFYKLRAKVTVENLSDSFDVVALWDGALSRADVFTDPRHAALGQRAVMPRDTAEQLFAPFADEAAYDAHRIACGVAKGGVDFAYGDAFPHEANMDRIGGVDFGKGCYVGQEVVSRMQHRGTARTRIVRVTFDHPPATGSEIVAGGKSLGIMGSASATQGLALLRLDRAADALAAAQAISADGVVLNVCPADLQMPDKRTVA
jgi:folate-binding protein YgfZ